MSWTKGSLVLAMVAVLAFAACNYTEGQCHPLGEGGDNAGVGGSIISPNGAGGFGDVPPAPQDAPGPMPPDCNMVPQTPCYQKCLSDYEVAAAVCGKMENEAQRKTCQDSAYAGYKSCKDGCQKADDCKERCKKQCDKIHDRCHEDCTKNDPTQTCRIKCNNEYADCLLECEKDCE